MIFVMGLLFLRNLYNGYYAIMLFSLVEEDLEWKEKSP